MMPVQKIFWENPYLSELEAIVTGVQNDRITLDKTILYAFSGGQQSDSGTIGGYEVLEAAKEGKEIYYRLADNHRLKTGDNVRIQIDWDKRYKLMRLHFAAELVLELVYREFNRPEKIGANITSDKARVDFFWDGNIAATFPLLEEQIKDIVASDIDIISAFEDEESQKRTWEIAGFAKVPCGGTHLKKTGEVGSLSFKRNNIGKGKERIEIFLVTD